MNASDPSAQARTGALALLADGNSPESVAHVLGVSIDVVQGWQQGRNDAPIPERSVTDDAGHRPLVFDSELAYQAALGDRIVICICGLFIFAFVIALWHADRYRAGAGSSVGAMVAISIAVLALGIPFVLQVRRRFVFGTHGLSSRGAIWTSPELRYADLTKVSIVKDTEYVGRGARAPGYRVTFNARHDHSDPMSLFIFERNRLDVGIVERLRQLPGVTSRDLAPLANLPVKPQRRWNKLFGVVVVVALLGIGFKGLTLPDLPFQQAWQGQPSLQQLTHVAGDLRRFSGCRRDPFFPNRIVEVTLRLDDGTIVGRSIPCVMPADVFADGRAHRLSVDTYETPNHAPVVYQVALGDRVLLPYDTIRSQQTAYLPLFFLFELIMVLGLVFIIFQAARLLNDDNWASDVA